MIARNFELELDPAAGPVTERFTFTVVPEGLRVRLKERAKRAGNGTTRHEGSGDAIAAAALETSFSKSNGKLAAQGTKAAAPLERDK